jgi:hypothetical protein
MAFPTFTSIGGNSGGSNGTSHTVTIPARTAGELLVLLFATDGNPTITPASVDSVSWNDILRNTGANPQPRTGNSVVRSRVMYLFAGSTAAQSTISVSLGSTEAAAWRVFCFTGAHDTTPPEEEGTAGAASLNPNPPANNPSAWDTEDTFWLIYATHDDGADTFSAFPTANDNNEDRSTGAGGVGLGTCTHTAAVSSYDPGSFTISSTEDYTTGVIAIRPAPAAVWTPPAKRIVVPQAVHRAANW